MSKRAGQNLMNKSVKAEANVEVGFIVRYSATVRDSDKLVAK